MSAAKNEPGAASAEPLLRFEALAGGYGTAMVLRDVSGAIGAGQVLCVIGRNGVGKSTLLKLLLGHLPLRGGTVHYRGRSIGMLEASARHRLGISYSPQERPVFDELSVLDNLTLMRRDRDLAPFAPCIDAFPILAGRLEQIAGTLSGGEKKMLSFTRTFGEQQPLTVLDEPSEGVQWENVLRIQALIERRKADGASFVIVEQNLAFAQRVADHYLVLDHGAVTLSGAADDIGRDSLLAHLHV